VPEDEDGLVGMYHYRLDGVEKGEPEHHDPRNDDGSDVNVNVGGNSCFSCNQMMMDVNVNEADICCYFHSEALLVVVFEVAIAIVRK